MPLPSTGLDRDEVFRRLEDAGRDDLETHGGRTWAYVFDAGRRDVDEVGEEAYRRFLHHNGLDPTVFPSMLQLENQVVGVVADHLGGDTATVGSFTSGGTESCMLAVKSARDHARATRGVERPTMVLPETAHAAFSKGAHYLGVEAIRVPVDPATFAADVDAMAAAIDERTVLLVASAPSYAHGVIDPVEALGALAADHDLLLHVDACIGGWLLGYLRRLGEPVPPFDLSVPGVTSLSVDLHKYAYCPKGASVLLHRDAEVRHHQLYACATWPGYTVINPTIASTKSGGPLAAAWATLHYVGDDGYLELARRTRRATTRLIEGIGAIDGLEVLGAPQMSLVAATSDAFDVFEVVDEMRVRGWYVQPQMAFGASPRNLHFSSTSTSLEAVDAMLVDLAAACEAARAVPPDPDAEALRASLAELDPDDFTPRMYADMLAMAGLGGEAALPERMAEINALLEALPSRLQEQLLTAFVNDLFRPERDRDD